MNRMMGLTAALAVFCLPACGKGDADTSTAGGAPSSRKTRSGGASAEEVAKEMRGKVRCPARASTARLAGMPVDDVVGLRPGMSWDEAANFALCDNPLIVVSENSSRGYSIKTYGQHVRQGFDAKFAEPRVVRTSEQMMRDMGGEMARRSGNAYVAPLQPGQARYYVSSMGMPGQEQVVSVAREEYFAEGKLPAVDVVRDALIGKYGEPSHAQSNGAATWLWWEYDPAGGRIAQGSPLHAACRISVSPDAGSSLTPDCGVTVGALITAAKDNPGLAHSLAVTSQNGADGYAALTRTEEALRRSDESRRLKELKDAKKSADGPKL